VPDDPLRDDDQHGNGRSDEHARGNSRTTLLVPVIAGVFAVVAAVLGAVLSREKPAPPPTPPTTTTAPASTTHPATTTSTTNPSLSIQALSDGARIPVFTDVRVRLNAATDRGFVWILVRFANGDVVYPQGACDRVEAGGSVRTCPGVQFGDPGQNVGAHFSVTAVLVDEPDAYPIGVRHNGFPSSKPPVKPLAESDPIVVRRS